MKHLKYTLLLFTMLSFARTQAQITSLLFDDFESYASYQVCNGYTTDIQVYPIHGTNASKGLRAFMNSFDSKDSLVTGWVGPFDTAATAYFQFEFRVMEASALYPNMPGYWNSGDQFTLSYTTDNIHFTNLRTWNASNFNPTTLFTTVNLTLPTVDSARFKFLVTRTNNTTDYFVDIDNLNIGFAYVGLSAPPSNQTVGPFPSPFSDYLRVTDPSGKGFRYDVMDLLGNVKLSGKCDTGTVTIDTEELPAGSYLIRMNGPQIVKTYRVQKYR